VPIYATGDAALAAEVGLETFAINFSSRNLLRNFFNRATNEAFRHRLIREVIFENSVQLRTPRRISAPPFVVMPEHVHLLITPAPGITLEGALQLIKGGYSHAFGSEFGRQKDVWQRGFTDHRIRDAADFELHRGYIHQNPVKRQLVQTMGRLQILLCVSWIQAGWLALSG
jgi:REP element-mobilizing transposase RayT